MSLAIAAMTVTGVFSLRPRIVWNATASAPLGLYWLDDSVGIARGNLVLANPPIAIRRLAAERGYLPSHVALVKRIVASQGDTICSHGETITVNGRAVAKRLSVDARGRVLPHWAGCRTLGKDDFFLLMATVSTSFDGRYFGPVERSATIGRLTPLWTW